jgi:hypothetical protein
VAKVGLGDANRRMVVGDSQQPGRVAVGKGLEVAAQEADLLGGGFAANVKRPGA